MRITKISVTGLFGQYDHTIPLNQEDRITIIHGPNGVGKTVLLRMVQGLFQANYIVFRETPFREFRVDMAGDLFLKAEAESQNRIEAVHSGDLEEGSPHAAHPRAVSSVPIPRYQMEPAVTVSGPEEGQEYRSISCHDEFTHYEQAGEEIAQSLPNLREVEGHCWVDQITGETLTLEDVHAKYAHRLERYFLGAGPPWLAAIQETTPVVMLRTDRLEEITALPRPPALGSAEKNSVPLRIKDPLEYCQALVCRARDTAQRDAELAAEELRRTFPARLASQFESEEVPAPTMAELRHEFTRLQIEQHKLVDTGLTVDAIFLEGEGAPLSVATRKYLALCTGDSLEYLRCLDGYLAKVSLFEKIVNDRLARSQKRLRVDVFNILTVFSPSDLISPNVLSSGEKQQIVLFSTLLFGTLPGTLVLIDEPELSMHIAWQQKFLRDLGAVAKLCDLCFLIATHSPDIIYDRWDLTVELKGSGPDEEEH